jgi:hypothetical protein
MFTWESCCVLFDELLHPKARVSWVVRFLENPFDGCKVFDCIIMVVLFAGIL